MVGAEGEMEMEKLASVDPAEFVALMVQGLDEDTPEGVPLITQVLGFILSPVGKVGFDWQLVMRALLSSKREGDAKKGIATNPNPKTPLQLMAGGEGTIFKESDAVEDPAGFEAVTV